MLDPATGCITMAPNVSSRPDFDLRSILADALGLDVVVENDVNMAAARGVSEKGGVQSTEYSVSSQQSVVSR